MGFEEEDHRGRMPFSLHSIKSIIDTYPITVVINFDHLAKVVVVGFPHCKVTPLSLGFPSVLFRRNSLCAAHTSRVESYASQRPVFTRADYERS